MKKTAAFVVQLSLLILLLITLATPGVPQNPPATDQQQRPRKVFPQELDPDDVVRTDTDVVSVDIMVTDATGRPVKNLRQEDFKVFSDDREQQISFFQLEKRQGDLRPLAIVFALDVSGSMTSEEIVRLRGALQSFSNYLADYPVSYAVMTFGMRVKTLQKFTTDPRKLDESLKNILKDAPSGLSTHTYDAVDDAIRLHRKCASKARWVRPSGYS